MSLSPPETTPPLEPSPPPVDDARDEAVPPPLAGTRWGLWRHADFVKLWTASTISLFGSQVSMIAIPAIAIITLKVSPFEAAMLGFFEMLPFILFTLPAGVWVDRLRRRPILIAGDVGRAIALATIPIAFAAGALTIWQLYLVGFTTGILTVFFDVADQSYLPSLLEADQLVEGNSKLQVSVSAAQIGGQGVGGAIIGLVTAPFAVLADALSFLGSAVLIYLIRKPEHLPPARPAGADASRGPGMRTEIAEGLRYVLGNRYLRNIAASTGTSNLFNSLMFSIFFVYVFRTLELSPLTIGLVGGLGNIGFLDRRAHRRAARAPHRGGPGDRAGVRSGRGDGAPHPARARVVRGDPVHLRLDVRGQFDGRHLQREPGLAAPGDHARADAGPDERDDAVHRLGHDADRDRSSAGSSARRSACTRRCGSARSAAASRSCRCSCRRSARCGRSRPSRSSAPARRRRAPGPAAPQSRSDIGTRTPALARDLDRPLVARVGVADDAHARVGGQDPLELAARRARVPSATTTMPACWE